MERGQGRCRLWVAALLLPGIAACSSANGTSHEASYTPGAEATSPPAATASPTATRPPKTIPPIPSGVYRLALTQDEVLAAGGTDLSNAGVWTFTVKPGEFRLQCVPISDSPEDCGNHIPTSRNPYLVEIGDLRGDNATMWIVEDNVLRQKLTGCVRHSTVPTGCGTEDSYRLTWTATKDGLEFTNFFGVGDQMVPPGTVVNWTMKPWTKIA